MCVCVIICKYMYTNIQKSQHVPVLVCMHPTKKISNTHKYIETIALNIGTSAGNSYARRRCFASWPQTVSHECDIQGDIFHGYRSYFSYICRAYKVITYTLYTRIYTNISHTHECVQTHALKPQYIDQFTQTRFLFLSFPSRRSTSIRSTNGSPRSQPPRPPPQPRQSRTPRAHPSNIIAARIDISRQAEKPESTRK
jgi:hypothetical protein